MDLSEFRQLNGFSTHVGRCAAAMFVATLDADEQEKVLAALEESSIQSSAIFRWLKLRGYERAEDTVRKHRGGRCACARS